MGGSLQPFFAERNLAAQTAMSSNNYRAPEDALGKGGETDVALAVSIAAMEHQQLQRRTQEAQRLGYASHDRAEPSTESARRQTYQGAQHLPPLQYRRPSQPSLPSGREEGSTLQPTQSWEAGSGANWDAEISNRMSGQQAQPLTPRVNAMAAVTQPVESSETSRARLEQRLKLYGLCERKIKGDGACQFRSISDQLYRTQDYHHEVRRVAIHQLRSNFQDYSQFVPSDYWKYVYEMEQSETWGDHICLQAIADAYGLKINIITSYPAADTCFIGITPKTQTCHRVLYLSFWAEIHYQSVYPISDPPASEKFLGSKKLARWLA